MTTGKSLARRDMRTEQNQVEYTATSPTIATSRALAVISTAIAIGVFILDTITPTEIALAVLYVGVVLLSARFLQKSGVVLASLGLMALTVLSYMLSEHDESAGIALSNCLLSLAAIGVTAFLAVQSQSREMVLREQAGLLDLTHDTVFVRDMNDVITYWNRGAEELYGWKRGEAVGKITHQLMQTIFPKPLEEITAEFSALAAGKGNSSTRRKTARRQSWRVGGLCNGTHGAGPSRSWRPITTSLSASRPKMPCGEARPIWRKRRD